MDLSVEELGEHLELSSDGLTRDAATRRDSVFDSVRQKRRQWMKNRLLYQMITNLLDSLEQQSLSGELGASDLKFYKRLERRWFEAHCPRSAAAAPSGEDAAGAEMAAEVAERVRNPLREQLADARYLCGLGDADVACVSSAVTARCRLSQALTAEVERVRSQTRHSLLACVELSDCLGAALKEIFDTHRRVRQPRFDLVSLKLLTENLRTLVAKLHKLVWESRAALFSPAGGLLDGYLQARQRLGDLEERWRRDVQDLERALTKYRLNEDDEYCDIVRQFEDCRGEIHNRRRVLSQLKACDEPAET